MLHAEVARKASTRVEAGESFDDWATHTHTALTIALVGVLAIDVTAPGAVAAPAEGVEGARYNGLGT